MRPVEALVSPSFYSRLLAMQLGEGGPMYNCEDGPPLGCKAPSCPQESLPLLDSDPITFTAKESRG